MRVTLLFAMAFGAWATAPAPPIPRWINFETEWRAVEGVPMDVEIVTEEVTAWKGPAPLPHTPVMSDGNAWSRYVAPVPPGGKVGLYLGDLRVIVSRPVVDERPVEENP